MDGLGALALGGEPALEKYMKEKPKSRNQSLVSKSMMSQILVAGSWITVVGLAMLLAPQLKNLFVSTKSCSTAFFSMFVLSAVFNGFNVRSEGVNILEHLNENKGFIKVMTSIVLILILITFIGGDLFQVTPLTLKEWVVVTILSIFIIPIDLLRKKIVGNSEK